MQGLEILILWGFAALGVYHLIFRLKLALARQKAAANSVRDAANQLRFVMAAPFRQKKLMWPREYHVFKIIEKHIQSQHRGYRVFAQTSLGEMIGSDDQRAFNSINSKRVDFLILGPTGYSVAAIEYQGGEHHQGNAAARDAVKKEALRRAAVTYIEIETHHSDDDVRNLVRDAILRAGV